MSARLLDGKIWAAELKEKLKERILELKARAGTAPRLVSIMVGDDPGTKSYVLSQQRAAQGIGIDYVLCELPASATQDQLLARIHALNTDPAVHGVLLNKPLPAPLDFARCADAISSNKDVEGMNVANLGRVLTGQAALLPCTPAAAVELLKSAGVPLAGKEAVVLGRSEIVGKPVALMLLKEDMTVTVCHSKTAELQAHVRRADVVVAAIGRPFFLKGDWVKPGAIVIDVGINQHEGKIVGDVDAATCQHASFITPVPGGVGPVTSVMLMRNAVQAFHQHLYANQ